MAKILKFPKVPELDWLEESAKASIEDADRYAAEGAAPNEEIEELRELGEKMLDLHKYLKWSRIYQLTHAYHNPREHETSLGLLTKYHRRVYGMDPFPEEMDLITKAEKMLADSNAEKRRRKAEK